MSQCQILQYVVVLSLIMLSPAFAQNHGTAAAYRGKHIAFNKAYLTNGKTIRDSADPQSQSKADSTKTKTKIKIGKIVGFATMGFLSGLFFGASTADAGFFQGAPVFHLKPALIGAGIGIIASFILPDKTKKPSTSSSNDNEKQSFLEHARSQAGAREQVGK